MATQEQVRAIRRKLVKMAPQVTTQLAELANQLDLAKQTVEELGKLMLAMAQLDATEADGAPCAECGHDWDMHGHGDQCAVCDCTGWCP